MSALVISDAVIDRILSAAIYTLPADRFGPLTWTAQPNSLPADLPDDLRPPPTWVPDLTPRGPLTPATATVVGTMLLAENRASVAHRYRFPYQPPHYRYGGDDLPGRPLSVADLLSFGRIDHPGATAKAIEVYEYQSCEHPGWWTSEARSFCAAIRERVC